MRTITQKIGEFGFVFVVHSPNGFLNKKSHVGSALAVDFTVTPTRLGKSIWKESAHRLGLDASVALG
jgi:hypothetical protein